MRTLPLLLRPIVAACTGEANHIGNRLLLPSSGVSTVLGNAGYNQTRGQIKVFVKTNHPALIDDIRAGGGSTLTEVFDIANIASNIRALHTLRLQSDLQLYENSLDALVVAIMVVSDP